MLKMQRKQLTSLAQVEQLFKIVYSNITTSSPFTSQHWQLAWANSLEVLPEICIFTLNQKPIGFCWLSKTRLQKAKLFAFYTLNQMGNTAHDQVWIEHNGIVAPSEQLSNCYLLLFKALKEFKVFKLYISMASQSDIHKPIIDSGFKTTSDCVEGYRTNLNRESVIDQFSKNSRSQVRRSKRHLEQRFGEIQIFEAEPDERSSYLGHLAEKHIERWGKSEEGSGFTNPYFLQHHNYLLQHSLNETSVVKVCAGQTVIGYSYSLLAKESVYFYCAGINYDIACSKIKPGITLHTELMEFYKSKGYHWYDFLGGYARYKESLSTNRYLFTNVSIYTRSFFGSLAYRLTLIKERLL